MGEDPGLRAILALGLSAETWRHHYFRFKVMRRFVGRRRDLASLDTGHLHKLIKALVADAHPVGDYVSTINLLRRMADRKPVLEASPSMSLLIRGQLDGGTSPFGPAGKAPGAPRGGGSLTPSGLCSCFSPRTWR